jgi:hypothetical protein
LRGLADKTLGIVLKIVITTLISTSLRRQVTPAWMEKELRTAGIPGQ